MSKYKDVILFTRKVNKENFTFIKKTSVSCINNMDYEYLIIETQENCFGYSDSILFSGGQPYTLHRHKPKWILNKLKKIAINNKLEKLIFT